MVATLLLACAAPAAAPPAAPRSPAAPAASPVEDLREILAHYARHAEALSRSDPEVMIALRVPEFTVHYPTGQIDDALAAAESMRRFFWTNKPPIMASFAILKIESMTDKEAVLQILQRSRRHQELAGKLRRVDHDVTQRETWVRTPAGWRIKRVDQIRNRHRWIDGIATDAEKPFDPEAAPYLSPTELYAPPE